MLKYAVIPPPLPPGEDELPCDDGAPLESERHRLGIAILLYVLQAWLRTKGRTDVYVAGNMALYYSQLQVFNNDFRAPDVFVVLDTVVRERKSWVVWMEGQAPDVVIELVSDSTESEDRGRKKRIYARGLRVPLYCIYDPFSARLDAYVLDVHTGDYVPAPRGPDGAVAAPLGLELAVWEGTWQNVQAPWLRWREAGGAWLPTPDEAAEQERQRAEQERQRAEQERQRAEQEHLRATTAEDEVLRLKARLAALGITDA